MGGALPFTNPPPDTDKRGLMAKLTSETSQPVAMLNPVSLTVSSICNHVYSALAWQQLQCARVRYCGRGRPIRVSYTCLSGRGGSLRRANHSYYRYQYFFKFKPILPMQWSVRSYGCRVACLYQLSCKNGVPSRLQICNRERAGMGPPTLQISDKSVKNL